MGIVLKELFRFNGTCVMKELYSQIQKLEKKIRVRSRMFVKQYWFGFQQNLQLVDNSGQIMVADLITKQQMSEFQSGLQKYFNIGINEYKGVREKYEEIDELLKMNDDNELVIQQFRECSLEGMDDYEHLKQFIRLKEQKYFEISQYRSDGSNRLVNLLLVLKVQWIEQLLENGVSEFYEQYQQNLKDLFIILVVIYYENRSIQYQQQKQQQELNRKRKTDIYGNIGNRNQIIGYRQTRQSVEMMRNSLRQSIGKNRSTWMVSAEQLDWEVPVFMERVDQLVDQKPQTRLFRILMVEIVIQIRKNIILQSVIRDIGVGVKNIPGILDIESIASIGGAIVCDLVRQLVFQQTVQSKKYDSELQLDQLLSNQLQISLIEFIREQVDCKDCYLEYPQIRQTVDQVFKNQDGFKGLDRVECEAKYRWGQNIESQFVEFDKVYETRFGYEFRKMVDQELVGLVMIQLTDRLFGFKEGVFVESNLDSLYIDGDQLGFDWILQLDCLFYLVWKYAIQLQKIKDEILKNTWFEKMVGQGQRDKNGHKMVTRLLQCKEEQKTVASMVKVANLVCVFKSIGSLKCILSKKLEKWLDSDKEQQEVGISKKQNKEYYQNKYKNGKCQVLKKKDEIKVCLEECLENLQKTKKDCQEVLEQQLIIEIKRCVKDGEIERMVQLIDGRYQMYCQILDLDQQMQQRLLGNIGYCIYKSIRLEVVESRTHRENMVRLVERVDWIDLQIGFLGKEKQMYLRKTRWFLQLMSVSDDQFISLVKSKEHKFRRKQLAKLVDQKWVVQKQKQDNRKQIMEILKAWIIDIN